MDSEQHLVKATALLGQAEQLRVSAEEGDRSWRDEHQAMVSEAGVHVQIAALRSRKSKPTSSTEEAAYPKQGERWSPQEEDRLREMWDQGIAIGDIALALGRAPGGISARLDRLYPERMETRRSKRGLPTGHDATAT